MIAYIDSSVLLRVVLLQPDPLETWHELELGVASSLIRVECHRAIDRLRHDGQILDADLGAMQENLETVLQRLVLRSINDDVLEIASRPLTTRLATLDAIHLATAIAYRATQPDDERPIVIATHDRALATAARAINFDVIGIASE